SSAVVTAWALATGAWLTCRTVILTVAGALATVPSLTTNWKVSTVSAVTSGARELGCAIAEVDSVTLGPAVGGQENVRGSPSGSRLPLPSRVTVVRSSTL